MLVILKTKKKPYPKVKIEKEYTRGCQLHGDPIDYVDVIVVEAGYKFKKGVRYCLQKEQFDEMKEVDHDPTT